jgi:hypothetical protein
MQENKAVIAPHNNTSGMAVLIALYFSFRASHCINNPITKMPIGK